MKPKTRKLLSVTGAVVFTLGATATAATGNLMARPPRDPNPPAKKSPDAGTPAPDEKPAEKKQGGA